MDKIIKKFGLEITLKAGKAEKRFLTPDTPAYIYKKKPPNLGLGLVVDNKELLQQKY